MPLIAEHLVLLERSPFRPDRARAGLVHPVRQPPRTGRSEGHQGEPAEAVVEFESARHHPRRRRRGCLLRGRGEVARCRHREGRGGAPRVQVVVPGRE